MKAFLAVLSLLFCYSVIAADFSGHYSGGILSTVCRVPLGGQFTLDISGTNVTARVVDDGVETATFAGGVTRSGAFVCRTSEGDVVRGRIRARPPYVVFTGSGRDSYCLYRIQGRLR